MLHTSLPNQATAVVPCTVSMLSGLCVLLQQQLDLIVEHQHQRTCRVSRTVNVSHQLSHGKVSAVHVRAGWRTASAEQHIDLGAKGGLLTGCMFIW